MPPPPPPLPPPPSQRTPAAPSLPLSQASHLLTSFTQFLTIGIHNILYYRSLYPASTFLASRAYNLPVHQSRHPRVCAWVRDAVDAVQAQLVLGVVERIAVVIYGGGGGGGGGGGEAGVMERWMFDVAGFPAWKGFRESRGKGKGGDRDVDDEGEGVGGGAGVEGGVKGKVNWTNVDEQLRAAIRRLAYAGEKMAPLPEGCTFTVAVELRDEGEAPIGHPQPWIPTQPSLQTKSKDRPVAGDNVGGAKTTPLRAVEAGPLFFECWVEEGKAKEQSTSAPPSAE